LVLFTISLKGSWRINERLNVCGLYSANGLVAAFAIRGFNLRPPLLLMVNFRLSMTHLRFHKNTYSRCLQNRQQLIPSSRQPEWFDRFRTAGWGYGEPISIY
jgi:hypothetical protein